VRLKGQFKHLDLLECRSDGDDENQDGTQQTLPEEKLNEIHHKEPPMHIDMWLSRLLNRQLVQSRENSRKIGTYLEF